MLNFTHINCYKGFNDGESSELLQIFETSPKEVVSIQVERTSA